MACRRGRKGDLDRFYRANVTVRSVKQNRTIVIVRVSVGSRIEVHVFREIIRLQNLGTSLRAISGRVISEFPHDGLAIFQDQEQTNYHHHDAAHNQQKEKPYRQR